MRLQRGYYWTLHVAVAYTLQCIYAGVAMDVWKKKKRRASKYTGRRFLCFNTQHILQPWQFYLYSKLAVLVNSFSVVNIPVWPLWLTTLRLWWITEQRTCGITRLPSLPAWKDMLRCEGFSEISKTLRLSETCQALWILILNTWLTI